MIFAMLPVAFDNHFVAGFGEQAKVFGASFDGARFGTSGTLQPKTAAIAQIACATDQVRSGAAARKGNGKAPEETESD